MTLNQFLDVAYTLLVDEYRRLGASLTEALERTREYAAGGPRVMPVTAGSRTEEVVTAAPQSGLTPEELQNEQALAALEQAMAGVGGIR